MQNLSHQSPQEESQRDKDKCMLDIAQLASSGSNLSGQTQAEQMPRTGVVADWSVQVKRLPEHGRYQLHLRVQADIPLQCQRCLQPLLHEAHIDRDFLLLQGDEAQASALDEQEKMDVLPFNGRFDLLGLLEDELILETPFAPMHVQCPKPLPVALQAEGSNVDVAKVDGEPQAAKRPNPFAALSQLNITKRPPRNSKK